MVIENFVVYKYKNVFYTKEELEQMGFIYMESREDYFCLKENNPGYSITEKSISCETIHSIEEYLNWDESGLVGKFLFDFGNCGLILGVEKYYGIRCKYEEQDKKEIIQLFNNESDSYSAYSKIENEIKKIYDDFAHHTASIYNGYSEELIKQNQEKETRQRVLSLINKVNK